LHLSPLRALLAFGFLIVEPPSGAIAALRAAETIGRPLGGPAFLERVAAATGRKPRGETPGDAMKRGFVQVSVTVIERTT
jgi:hypothetical protein